MNANGVEQALTRLVDAINLFRLQPTRMTGLLADEATDALVAGWDSPALRQLAGASSTDNLWALDALVDDVTSELNLPTAAPGEGREVQAAAAMCRRALRGEVGLREVARWAHQVIGHEGPQALQQLVELDDQYDIADIGPLTLAEVEELAQRTVTRLATSL